MQNATNQDVVKGAAAAGDLNSRNNEENNNNKYRLDDQPTSSEDMKRSQQKAISGTAKKLSDAPMLIHQQAPHIKAETLVDKEVGKGATNSRTALIKVGDGQDSR